MAGGVNNVKKVDDDVMSKICDAMAIFPINCQFMVILPPPTSKKPLKIPPELGLKLR